MQMRPQAVTPAACRVDAASKEDQHLDRACRPTRRHRGGRRRNLDRQLHALRSRIHRSGAKNLAIPYIRRRRHRRAIEGRADGKQQTQESCDSKAVHMSMLSIGLALAIRAVLVLLFLPFSALDKALDFRSAVAQAQEAMPNKAVATALIIVGLFVEVFMSAGVVSGIADRACALVLAGYCAVTALVWKQFWRPGDFWRSSKGKARALFWDFWKNLALAAGFLLIVFGTDASSIAQFFAHPTIQSHPYRLTQEHVRP